MLTTSKKAKLLASLKGYCRQYLHSKLTELDESGTRLMINSFLTDVLGYLPLEEVKTEYMIRGTYADYVIQTKGVRHFLVEVKALSLALSDKHLRQAVNYGANEGIEWALLTNGKSFELYRILFNKPIEARRIFSIDLAMGGNLKEYAELFQFLHKDSVANKGLSLLWNKNCALDPLHVAGLLYAPTVIQFIKRTLKTKYQSKFSDEDILQSLNRVIQERINSEMVKPMKVKKERKTKVKLLTPATSPGNNPVMSDSGTGEDSTIL